MARPLRIQYENAYYHVTRRGNARQEIYLQDVDRTAFLKFLARSAEIWDKSGRFHFPAVGRHNK